MKQRSLGGSASHIKVGEIGFGCMGIFPPSIHLASCDPSPPHLRGVAAIEQS